MKSALSKSSWAAGFTLIELSIVLVIIGLIVGGVLVGQELVRAAYVRAQVSQIEKYNTAVNTFRGKFGYLPGDINATAAAQFGFAPRGPLPGEGDGNGVIEGVYQPGGSNNGANELIGETVMFWVDLSAAQLIDGSFNTASPQNVPDLSGMTSTGLGAYYPEAKVGGGNYIYVWSGGINTYTASDGRNYYGLSVIGSPCYQCEAASSFNAIAGVTVAQAYSIDKKMDDGLPQSGRVSAMFINTGATWASGNTGYYTQAGAAPGTAAPPTNLTCYDNGNNASAPMQYSLSQNSGTGVNCALSFQFQ
jgi:prepilin-type N-terminal cleavage/methylation domain-containing protein